LAFGSLYLFLLLPFLASGFFVATIVARYAADIHYLYLWDLLGAGLGCLGIFIFPSLIGGEETLIVVATGAAISMTLLARRGSWELRVGCCAILGILFVSVLFQNCFEFSRLTCYRVITLVYTTLHIAFSRTDVDC